MNQALYEVRESEAQALVGLSRAEIESGNLEELPRRVVRILTRAFRARSRTAAEDGPAGRTDGCSPRRIEAFVLHYAGLGGASIRLRHKKILRCRTRRTRRLRRALGRGDAEARRKTRRTLEY